MKRLLSILVFITIYLCTIGFLKATHIVGAELYYECINPATNQYRLTLKMYRDCLSGQAPFDNPITLFVFSAATGQAVETINIPIPPMTPVIQPDNLDACVATTPAICVEEGVYTTIINLSPLVGGYDLAWARCCRNAAIDNLANPLGEGITFLAHVPDPGLAICNTMPQFTQTPPIFLCANEPFFFDHAAIDPDEDSLSYALTNPYTGLNFQNIGVGNPNQGGPAPVTDPFNNPMGPPPYQNVDFRGGFRFADPFGSGNFNLDPNTGFISVTPTRTGIFVFSISVFEWRNGQLLSENRRDFQIHVLSCRPQGDPPLIEHDLSSVNANNDTIFAEANVPFCYSVTVNDRNNMDVLTAYTVSAAFGRGSFFRPAATFAWAGTNPIQGEICWRPACNYDGQVVPLIIGARDIGDCPNISDVFDTIYVKISAPENLSPEITPDYANLIFDNDTIVANAMSNFCYTFNITDPNASDIINAFTTSPIFDGPNPPSFTTSGNNPVQGQICWTPDCDLEGQVVELAFSASDASLESCTSSIPAESKTFIRIEVPPNDPPAIASDLTGNTFNGDTIFVDAMNAFCYNFQVQDINTTDQLVAFTQSSIFGMPDGPSFSVSGTNPLQGQICWTPDCDYEGQVVELVIGAQDEGMCREASQALDTVYIKISVPPNEPPAIVNDLSGLNSRNDTVFVEANGNLCYTFDITDPNLQDELQAFTVSPIFNEVNAPSVTFSGTNPIVGEICWTPDCEFAGEVVALSIGANDNGMCSSQENASSTVYVSIAVPPNDPPTVTHNLAGLTSSNDTVFVFAEEQLCYDVVFRDANTFDSLSVEVLSSVFSTDGATFTPLGTNPIQGQVCWVPSCEFEGQIVPLMIKATDNGECNNFLEVIDTVYVNIQAPESVPPVVTHDISGTNNNGDTVFVFIGDGLCYDFTVEDRTPLTSIDYTFEFQDFGGTNIGLGTSNVQRIGNTIVGEVCFQSDCSNGGSLYRLIITGIDGGTCPPFDATKDTVFIKVDTDFESNVGPNISFCEGTGGIQLNVDALGGSAPYYYSWGCTADPNCGFSNPNAKNPIVNPTGTATYYVQITDRFGCTSEIDSVSVGVDALPLVDAGPDVSICDDGESVQLAASILNVDDSPGPYTFEWLPAAGLNNTDVANPIATPATTTIYTVVVRGTNGCSSQTTTLDTASTVVVRVAERPVSEAGLDQNLCFGESTLLAGFATGSGPDYTYQWSPVEGLDNPSSQNPTANPLQTTTYYLTASSNGCLGIADSLTIEVKNLPEVDPGSNYEICATDQVALDGTATGAATETFTYRWSPATGLSDQFEPQITASPDTTTTYTLIATSNFGCNSLAYEVNINVLPTPRAEAGDDAFICRLDSIQLGGSHSFFGGLTPPGEPIYSWIPVSGINNPNIPNPSVSPTETQIYTLTVTYGACETSDQVKIDVFNTIQTTVSSDRGEICSGESVQLTAMGGVGSALFSWSPALTLDDPNSATPIANPSENTTYYVQISEGGCEAIDSVMITVNQTPIVDFSASTAIGCVPTEVNFVSNTQYASSFIWEFGDGMASTEPNPVYTYEVAGTYQVTLTAIGDANCRATVTGEPIFVAPKGIADFSSTPGMNAPQILPSVNFSFLDQSINAVSYAWDFGDGNRSTEQNPVHSYFEAGDYTVTLIITDAGGCQDTAIYSPFAVLAPDLFIPNVFSPNQDGINDDFKVRYSGKERFYMEIFDRWGKRMFQENGNPDNGWNGQTSSGNNAGDGVYYYLVKIGDKSYTGDLTLMR